MEKRGLSHIETVLSFVLFIGFLVFAFFFFNPFQSNRTLETTLEYAFLEIEDNITATIESYSVVTSGNGVIGIDLANEHNASVEDENRNEIDSFTQDGVAYFDPPGNFAVIRFNEEFTNDNSATGSILAEGAYNISSSDTKQVYSERRFNMLKESYESKYLQLKKDFNLPNRVDFGFEVLFDDATSIKAELEIPSGIEVTSNIERIEILRSDGKIEFADLIVKVW